MAMLQIPCLACRASTAAAEDASSVSCASCGIALPAPGEAAWLMTRSGADQYGPYTLAQLGEYIAERRILPGDGIWYQGASVRLNVNQLPPFGAVAAPAMPVAPAPAPTPATPASGLAAEPAAVTEAVPAPVAEVAPAAASLPTPTAAVFPATQQGNKAGMHIQRALNWNLSELPVEPDEEAALLAK